MDEKDMKINMLLMEEMGLEEGERRRIIDQDTMVQYQMNGRDIVSPGSQGGKSAIEFDPINNTRMMSFMFGKFVEKLEDDEAIPPVTDYSIVPVLGGKVQCRLNMEDGDSVASKAYKNETTCYADMVLRLNGETDIDLSEYDIDRYKPKTSVEPPNKNNRKRK